MTPELRRRALRLGALGVLIVAALLTAELTGLRQSFTIAHVRAVVLGAGAYGVLVYVVAFSIGELIHVPGLLFVAAGVAIWGRLWGGVVSWAASVIALSVAFLVVRAIGGRALAGLSGGRLARALGYLERAPLRTVALLRAVLVISPPVTYALALSPVRFVDYALGSALGLIPPMALAAIGFQWLLRHFGG